MLRPINLHPSMIGSALPWDVFTEAGVLVASAGTLIADEAQYRRVIGRQLYRETAPGEASETPPGIQLLERFDTLAREADGLLTPPYNILLADQLRELLRGLFKALRSDPEACLGYVRRARLARPSVQHSLHVLCVSILVSDHLDFSEAEQSSLAGAALTMNLAVLEIQDRLHNFPRLLDGADRSAIAAHPRRGRELLEEAGVDDADWLRAVEQHHENVDGSGYPARLEIESIHPMARVLRVADVYCAKISGRHYRPPQSSREAMREIFGRERAHLDGQISAQLLRTMGLYPPGTLVRLANGESACITRRGRSGIARFATSFLDARGRLLEVPRERPLDRQTFAIRGFLEAEKDGPEINWKHVWGYP
ncbi:MAG: HD domain-containing phosphohydrolase [Pseudomonadota bacterium]